MLDCTTDRYDTLYARWLVKPGTLLDLAEWEPGMKLFDLCGGTGIVAREALQRGSKPGTVTLFDLNPRCPDTRVRQVKGNAEELGSVLGDASETYDVVVCRQAIAYIDLEQGHRMLHDIHRLLKPGGRFVFNTFVQPRWGAWTYMFGGQRFVEASAYIGRHVWHVQILLARGGGWDMTHFYWHHRVRLAALLARHFDLFMHRSGASLRWVCTKPREKPV